MDQPNGPATTWMIGWCSCDNAAVTTSTSWADVQDRTVSLVLLWNQLGVRHPVSPLIKLGFHPRKKERNARLLWGLGAGRLPAVVLARPDPALDRARLATMATKSPSWHGTATYCTMLQAVWFTAVQQCTSQFFCTRKTTPWCVCICDCCACTHDFSIQCIVKLMAWCNALHWMLAEMDSSNILHAHGCALVQVHSRLLCLHLRLLQYGCICDCWCCCICNCWLILWLTGISEGVFADVVSKRCSQESFRSLLETSVSLYKITYSVVECAIWTDARNRLLGYRCTRQGQIVRNMHPRRAQHL